MASTAAASASTAASTATSSSGSVSVAKLLIPKNERMTPGDLAWMEREKKRLGRLNKLGEKVAEKDSAKARAEERDKEGQIIAEKAKQEIEYLATMRIFDRAALERRAQGKGSIGTAVYDAVFYGDRNNRPPFRLTVPALAEGVVLQSPPSLVKKKKKHAKGKGRTVEPTTVPYGEVMVELNGGEGGHEPVEASSNTRVLVTSAWITTLPGTKRRPLKVQCSVDNFETTKTVYPDLPYSPDSSNDPAKTATKWSMVDDARKAFDSEQHTPVTAHVFAAHLANPQLLYTRFTGTELTKEIRYFVDQPGVVICNEAALCGRGAAFPDHIVAVISEHHVCAVTMLYSPKTVAVTRLKSYALGTLEVGEGEGSTEEKPVVASQYLRQTCVYVVPFDAYKVCLSALRDSAIKIATSSCEMSKLQFRLAKEEKLEEGEVASLSVVTTYVAFDGKPTLLMRKNASLFGVGWGSVKLCVGNKTYDNANHWADEVQTLWGYLKSLLNDDRIDLLPLHTDGHTIDFDKLAILMQSGRKEIEEKNNK